MTGGGACTALGWCGANAALPTLLPHIIPPGRFTPFLNLNLTLMGTLVATREPGQHPCRHSLPELDPSGKMKIEAKQQHLPILFATLCYYAYAGDLIGIPQKISKQNASYLLAIRIRPAIGARGA
jgi:hypothetical protein